MVDWLAARVTDTHAWTERLHSLRFDAPLPVFKAGQFIRVALDIDGERVARPYSLVNAPGQSPAEIYFNPVPDGPLSPRLAKLGPGDSLWVSDSVNGFLTLDEIPTVKQLWLLATGTGVGPFVSILHTAEPWQRFETITLVHSVRHVAELGYRDKLDALKQHYPARFHYLPTVTRDTPTGYLGQRIPQLLTAGVLEAAADVEISPDQSHVMLCGSNAMIQDAMAVLAARGLKRHRRREPGHMTVEKYH